MMNSSKKLQLSPRFLRGMHGFLRRPYTIEQAKLLLRQRLEEREDSFLKLVTSRIYGHAGSPYLPLLRAADCTLGDIRNLLRYSSLENALHELRKAGVFITFEEFKGRKRIQRNGLDYRVTPEQFDNPSLGPNIKTSTSGTSGRGVQVTMSLDFLSSEALYDAVYIDALCSSQPAIFAWFQAFPGFLGPRVMLRQAKAGHRHFHLLDPKVVGVDGWTKRLKQRLTRHAFMKMMRFYGFPYPDPESIPLDAPHRVAQTLHDTLQTADNCLFFGYASTCLRVAQAASDMGLDMRRSFFVGGGEPVTPAKVNAIQKTGAHFRSIYSCSDTGTIGYGCLNPSGSNDNHLFEDALALIQAPRFVPEAEHEVDALYFTTLLSSAPKVMLNVESDDYAVVKKRDCGCPLHDLGFTTHVKDIFSFNKLTGQGVSLVGTDALRVLEEVLPSRFGGGALDYQLVEEEMDDGGTKIWLNVSPEVPHDDDAAIGATFLSALEGDLVANTFAAAQWRKSGSFQVRRARPEKSGRGKLLPLKMSEKNCCTADSQ